MDWKKFIDEEKVIQWRRHIHQYPELSFEEINTSNYIEEELQKMEGIEVCRPTKTSVVGILKGAKEGKTVGLRADIDALPILEETDVPFKSKIDGVMHACGHDCHAAMLLGAANVLSQMTKELQGTVKFIFQHAEEVLTGGAKDIIKTGILDDVDVFYGSHIFTDRVAGSILSSVGYMTASTDSFSIKVYGKGSHGAFPEASIDSILVGTQIAQNLYTIISRNITPSECAVLSLGSFTAGNAFNVIPDSAEMEGTVRTFNPAVRDLIEKRIHEIANGVCAAHGARCEVEYVRGDDSVFNDENCYSIVKQVTETYLPGLKFEPFERMMAGEDFSAYQTLKKGIFVGISAGSKENQYLNHHPKFIVDEAALKDGVTLYVGFALAVLNS